MAEKDKMAQKVNLAIASFALFIAFLGVIGLLIYTGAAAPFGVGLLAAIAAGSVGLLFGLLFGVPRAISSGQVRQNEQAMQAQSVSLRTVLKPELLADSQSDKASSEAQLARAQKFSTSTNLAEVSDWLTKLLLGAGLVSLTKLGAPIGRLIDSLARGVSSGSSVIGSAKVVAGAILFGYAAMGLLDGYILTTLWYQRKLNEDG